MKKFLILLVLLWTAQAQAATKYVDNICTNGLTTYNSAARTCITGSETVYSTIANGIAAMAGGDTLRIRGGTYVENINMNTIRIPSGTSWSNPTTIASYTGETVTIQPPDNGQGGINITDTINTDPKYIQFDGSAIGTTGEGIVVDGISQTTSAGGIGFYHSSFIRLNRIEVKNFRGSTFASGQWQAGIGLQISASGPTGAGVELNDINVHNNGMGLYLSGPVTVTGGKFHHHLLDPLFPQASYGIQVQYSGATGVIVQNAQIYENYYGGMNTNNSTNNTIFRFNKLWNNGNVGIQVSGGATNAIVYGNSIYGHYDGISLTNATNTTIKNNAAYGNSNSSYITVGSSGTVFQYNLCASGCSGTGVVNGNPLWTNAPIGDFSIPTNSPAVDTGTASITIGLTIPACSGGVTTGCYNGTAPDIGAYETGVPTVAGGPPTLTPNLTNVATGQPILVTVDDDDVNERIEDVGDWVGIFAAGTTAGSIDWFYMNGTKSAPTSAISDAVIPFTAPAPAGNYEFRFYRNNSLLEVDRLATAPFTVTAPGIVLKFNISSLKIGPSVTWKIGTP